MFSLTFILLFICLIRESNTLQLTTATVTDIQQEIVSGRSTCRQIIQGYLERINAYNRAGPQIGAVISTNPNALLDANALDAFYSRSRMFSGILHCAPLIVKDNIDVANLPTTNGVFAFRYQIPMMDAVSVRNAKQAGAILLGKANMSPFAGKEAWGNSETGGLIRNPFSLNRTTYGSSGGSGAGGAAMFSVLNFGTETGVSVNLPSSAANLVGLRPPVSLVSQEGVFPNSRPQDVVGPIAKKVEDVALLLDAEVGNCCVRFYSAPDVLNENGLQGARLNIFKTFAYDEFIVPGIGPYKVDGQIVDLFNTMVSNMVAAGAQVKNQTADIDKALNIILKMLTQLGYDTCMVQWRDEYLSNPLRFGLNAPFHSVADVVRSNTLPESIQKTFIRFLNISNPQACTQQMQAYLGGRQELIDNVLTPLLENADVAFWPVMPEFPSRLMDDAYRRDWDSRNDPYINFINAGSWSAYATLDLPLGFGSMPDGESGDGLPIGAIFIAKPENLKTLLKIAYAYQKKYGITKTPSSVPELPQSRCC